MRPSPSTIHASQEQLVKACAALRVFSLRRSQRARLDYHEAYIPPPTPLSSSKWVSIRDFAASVAGTLKRVFVFASVLTCAGAIVFGIYAGASWADATLRTGVHGDYFSSQQLQVGAHYYTTELPGRSVALIFRGTVATMQDLPTKGNQLGDLWRVNFPRHLWFWAVPDGATAAQWIDP